MNLAICCPLELVWAKSGILFIVTNFGVRFALFGVRHARDVCSFNLSTCMQLWLSLPFPKFINWSIQNQDYHSHDRIYYPARAYAARSKVISRASCPDS